MYRRSGSSKRRIKTNLSISISGKIVKIGEVVPAREGLRHNSRDVNANTFADRRSGSSKRRIKTDIFQ